ncbi:uncharacterized protein BX664DRAFT_319025 [Halteromyces radiatus]|uniref:uncharacterized protein n=1 Tax=Halteromyces radiatus TaxID=101107 RepID=UPI00221F8446|nr:uncharacterized protein BX664DRAFT_319025 [Halteromyces radiatus]KAI8098560.1 hypothetical protein BX664DRAFT_319025 [Halteromyces radiatus]
MLSHQDNNVDHLQSGMNDLRIDNEQYYQQHQQQQYQSPKEDSDDEVPLVMNHHQIPVSVQNIANHLNSSRPSHYIKPASQTTQTVLQDLPADIQTTQLMYNYYTEKTYLEGYLLKMNDLTVDGSSCGDSRWTRWYVELCGPVLTLWDAETNDDTSHAVIPQYINLADASVFISDQEHGVISLNSAGSNRFLLQPVDDNPAYQAPLWVCAMRLSCFEWSRIHEIYTMKFISRYNADVMAATKATPKMEGFVQVRLTGATEWQKYWTVVSDRRDEKSFFGKKKVPSRGQLSFYESKKQKHPNFIMMNVVHAYTLYPESPQLIDMATILKVEGSMASIKANGEQEPSKDTSSALIMASSRKELIQWLVAVFDSFKLYGRPTKIYDDPLNLNSLNFGELAASNPRLFLEIPEVQHVDIYQDTYIDNVASFAGVLLNKMTNPASRANQQWNIGQNNDDHRRSLPLEQSFNHPLAANRLSDQRQQQQQQQQGMTPSSSSRGGKLIYASDSDDDDDDDDDEEEEESDDDSLDQPRRSAIKTSQISTSMNKAHQQKKVDEEDTDDTQSTTSDVSDSSAPQQKSEPTSSRQRPRRRIVRPQASISGSGTDSDEDDDHNNTRGGNTTDDDDDDNSALAPGGHQTTSTPSPMMAMNNNPSGQFYDQQQQQQYHDGTMYDPVTGMYYDDRQFEGPAGMEMGEDGPVIPELGSRFATQNSLLDTYRPDQPSAKDQIEYAKQTGHTLLSVPNKPPEPRTGLVGMISQIEVDKKEQKLNKGRMLQMEKNQLLERERERYLWEQRQQMMPQMGMNQANMTPMAMNPPMGMNQYGMGHYGMGQMPMMDPRMSMMPPMMDPRMSMMPPMMDPRMSMMSPSMMNLSSLSNNNLDPRMSMNPSTNDTVDPRMSMIPPMMGQMPMMMDPRMSMMNMQMMMSMYQNGMWNQQQRFGGGPNMDDDDEDDDVPLGGGTGHVNEATSTNKR